MSTGEVFDVLRQIIGEAAPDDLPYLAGALAEARTRLELRLRSVVATMPVTTPVMPDVNLPIEEASRRLGVSRDWLYRNSGRLPSVRIGRRLLFPAAALDRWNRQRIGRR